MNSFEELLSQLGIEHVVTMAGVVEYRLKANGLKILFVENHAAPVATGLIVYHVGSRNEAVGHTGSTHFLEHMMFKGTKDRNPADGKGIDDLLKPLGALYNATTSYDRTNYFEVVPSEHLETVLAIEADRMRNLVLTRADRDSEMTVVRNEFERGENDPTDVMYKELMAIAFREHPYHHPVIGWRSDVEGVPMERMKAFYDTYYWPNNATLVVAGDFDPEAILKAIVKLFGSITASPHEIPTVYTTEPAQQGERTFVIRREGGDMPQVWVGFHVPNAVHQDTYALAACADLLGSYEKRSSRLYQGLVETGLAVECGAMAGQNRDPGLFILMAKCAPDVDPDKVTEALLEQVDSLKRGVAPQELARVKSANRKTSALQRDDSMSFAKQLCEGESCADWRWVMQYDDHYDTVDEAAVMRVASQYLVANNRTVGRYIEEAASKPAEVVASPAPAAKVALNDGKGFASRVRRIVLPNGLTVLGLSSPGTGTVAVSGIVRAGHYFGTYETALLPQMAAYMLTKGCKGLSKGELAEQLDAMGTRLQFNTGTFNVTFRSTVVKDDALAFLSLVGTVLGAPLFDEGELSKSRTEFQAFIQSNSSDTGKVAEARMTQRLYDPALVYHQKDFAGLLSEVAGHNRQSVVDFHAGHYSPKSTILAIVGDFDVADLEAMLPASLTEWQGVDAQPIAVSEVAAPGKAERIDVVVPGKANADIVIGLPVALTRGADDYYAALLANAALGADTLSSRLGLVVREKHGLTYGITCGFDNVTATGAPWKITLSVNPANIDKALGLVREVVDKYRAEGISEKELADEKGRAYGSFVVSLRSSLGIAAVLCQFESLGLPVSVIDELKAKYEAVTKAEVDAAIRKYFNLDHAVTVVAGTIGG